MAVSDMVREQVRECMAMKLGITTREIAEALNISKTTAWRHMVAVRNEWKDAGK